MALSKYREYCNEGSDDEDWSNDAKEMDDYNKQTRCGLDDPMALRTLDINIRLDLLHVMMLAYDVRPSELISFLNLLYPKTEEDGTAKQLKGVRVTYHPDEE